jgi:hypothetical protein
MGLQGKEMSNSLELGRIERELQGSVKGGRQYVSGRKW